MALNQNQFWGTAPTATSTTSSASPEGRVVVRDNTGAYFILDLATNTRYALAGDGSGSLQAAINLYGQPLTSVSQLPESYRQQQSTFLTSIGMDASSDAIFLDRRMVNVGPSAVEFFGGPSSMEQVVAGLADDPFTGAPNQNPQNTTNAQGVSFNVPGTVAAQDDAFAIIEEQLKSMGLPGLAGAVAEMLTTAPSEEQFWLWLKEQDEFQQRFSGIFDLQDRGEQIVPGGTLAQQVRGFLEYEQSVTQLLDQTGLSATLLRDGRTVNDLVNDALAGGVSAAEFNFRIGTVWRQVADAPPEVLAFFDEMFAGTNISGQDALAAFLLDPTMSEDELLQAAETATVGGAAAAAGFTLTGDQAQELQRQTGITSFGQASQGFSQAAQLRPLTIETVSETQDLTDFDAVQAAFGTNATADEVMRKRLENRQAKFGGGGGALAGQGGIVGLGTANS